MNAIELNDTMNLEALERSPIPQIRDVAENIRVERHARQNGLQEHLEVFRAAHLAIVELHRAVLAMQDLPAHPDFGELDHLAEEYEHVAWLCRKIGVECTSFLPGAWPYYLKREEEMNTRTGDTAESDAPCYVAEAV